MDAEVCSSATEAQFFTGVVGKPDAARMCVKAEPKFIKKMSNQLHVDAEEPL